MRRGTTGSRRYCSRDCRYKAMHKEGGKYVDKAGYVRVRLSNGSYAFEHRLVAAIKLGRPLTTNEHTHHVNGNKQDNRPENIEIHTNSSHGRLHAQQHKERGEPIPINRPAAILKRAQNRKANRVICSNCVLPLFSMLLKVGQVS